MKIYIVHSESLENGYQIEGFSNRKKAVSKVSKLKKEHRKEIIALKKDPKVVIKDLPISREGLIKAINYI
tara:strand:+ start:3273 stop:3482 length:210 start_codon:yes stop_codon:yes gene_type:complete